MPAQIFLDCFFPFSTFVADYVALNPLLWHVEEIHIVWNDYSCDHNHNDSGNAMHKSFRPYVLPPAFAIKTLLYVALFQILGLKVTSKVIIKSKTRQQKNQRRHA